ENRCQFGRAAAVEVAAEMFTNDKRQAERTGRHGTPRAQYLQVLSFSLLLRFELVTEFQNTTNEGHYWFFVIIVLFAFLLFDILQTRKSELLPIWPTLHMILTIMHFCARYRNQIYTFLFTVLWS
ncbi:hypothetical protein B296_00015301, partial [Ensete ventricosum]